MTIDQRTFLQPGWHPMALIGLLTVLGVACAPTNRNTSPDADTIWFYYEEPNCAYEDLGPVYAQSVARQWWGWTPSMVEEDAARKLRRKAADLGATEIIIQLSERGLPGATTQAENQSLGMHRFEGTAIRCTGARAEPAESRD